MPEPLVGPLGALLARFLGLGPLVSAQAEIRALRESVAALEDQQLARELEWRETKDQLYRHLKRVQALDQKAEARGGEPRSSREALRDKVLAIKLGGGNGQSGA